MDENFGHILDSLPEKRSRSRLEAYRALIIELLRRRRTYREIARVLLDRFQLHASIITIHDFVRRCEATARKVRKARGLRFNKRTKKNLIDRERRLQIEVTETPAALDEIQKRIADLKSRPIPGTETNPKIFDYDPEQPLTLPSKSKKKESDQ
jgi:hypothetical protein